MRRGQPPPGGDLEASEEENQEHYEQVASFLVDFIAHLESKPGFLHSEEKLLPMGVGLKINYPPLPPEEVLGVSLNKQSRLLMFGGVPFTLDFVCFACSAIPVGGSSPGGIGGFRLDPTTDIPNSDAAAYFAGYISVVPIEADYTSGSDKRFRSVINGFDF